MRAICGAIITAGALIGMGLVALAFGTRYHTVSDHRLVVVHLDDVDRPLLFMLVFTAGAVVIGLGISFLGLAYHHKRRTDEMALERERHSARQRTSV